jgi:hypothetical protein
MSSLAYVILAHESAEDLTRLVNLLLDADDTGHVIIHYDANAPDNEFSKLRIALGPITRAHIVNERARCAWGQFGLVDGVVRALRIVRQQGINCDRIFLMSGSCMPVRPLAQLKRFLDVNPQAEFIESKTKEWILGGLRDERFQYYHLFNERNRKLLFDYAWRLQQLLRLRRRFPVGLRPRFGSQWWCLTRNTALEVLEFVEKNARTYRFFKTTWIPDELFFQTIVYRLVGPQRVFGKSLTFYAFSNKARAVILYDEHEHLVTQLPYFFARKVSPRAGRLRQSLDAIARLPDDGAPLPVIGDPKFNINVVKNVSRQIHFPRPGQAFYGNQQFIEWPGALADSHLPLAILYGPSTITKLVRERLNRVPDLVIFGRIFRRDLVDLGEWGVTYRGLREDDNLIRDFDKPLYLSRLLDRADGFPVIAIAPGEDMLTEAALHSFHNAVFVACLPHRISDPDWLRLFWALTVLDHDKTLVAGLADHDALNEASHVDVRRNIDSVINRVVPRHHRESIASRITGEKTGDRILQLGWGINGDRGVRRAGKADRLLSGFGRGARPLFIGLADCERFLSQLSLVDLCAPLPNAWRKYFSEHLHRSLRNGGASTQPKYPFPTRVASMPAPID